MISFGPSRGHLHQATTPVLIRTRCAKVREKAVRFQNNRQAKRLSLVASKNPVHYMQ